MQSNNSSISTSSTKERISFGNHKSPFFTEVKKRVKQHFLEKGIESTGNYQLYLKASFFLVTYIVGYVFVTFAAPSVWLALGVCAYLGLCAAGIGFNLMHDGSHGSFSKSKWLNSVAAYSINLLGGDAMLWKNKHNIIHHTYTNIEGLDQDIAQLPVFRLNQHQKKYPFHKYQHIYCFPVYGLSSILWMFLLDYIKYFNRRIGNIKIPKITFQDHVFFWFTKVSYVILYIVVPSFYWGLPATLVGFFVYHFMLGLTISTIFQLAHVVEHTEFPDDHFETSKIEDEWAIHQMKTTANFATNNSFITWYVGGLNFQIEHHLFPKISHVHYPELRLILKEVCQEFGVPYIEYPDFSSALKSHLAYLQETALAQDVVTIQNLAAA